MEISLDADQTYSLVHLQDPENFHLIVISYKNEEIDVRVDNHFYTSFTL